jgi:hypothetical protein
MFHHEHGSENAMRNVNDRDEELLTPKEAAKFLKMSTSFLAKKRRPGGGGPAYSKVGRSIRYSKAALLRWLKSGECSPTTIENAPSITPEMTD